MEQVNKLEEMLNKKYEDWNQETLLEIIQSEEMLKLFTSETAAVLAETRENENIAEVMEPVKHGHYIREAKREIEANLEKLNEEGMTREEFREKIELMKDKGTLYKAASYLTVLSIFEEETLADDQEEISETLSEIHDLIMSINTEHGIQVIIEMLDLIYPIRELYFQRNEVDILKEENRENLDSILEEINQKAEEYLKFMEENGLEEIEDPEEK